MKLKWISGYFFMLTLALLIGMLFLRIDSTLAVILLATTAYALVIFVRFKWDWAKKIILTILGIIIAIVVIDGVLTLGTRIASGDALMSRDDFYFEYSATSQTHNVKFVTDLRNQIRVMPYIQWFMDGMPENIKFEYLSTLLLFIGVGIVLMVIFKIRWLKWLLFAPLAVFAIGWYRYLAFSSWIYFFYFMGLISYFVIERTQNSMVEHSEFQKTYFNNRKFVSYTLMMATLFVLIGFIGYKLFPVQMVNRTVSGLVPNLWGVRSEFPTDDLGVFSLIQTPFSNENGYLGGTIDRIDKEKPLFWVTVDSPQTTPLYLKSVVRDFYTGKRWVNQTKFYKNRFSEYHSEALNERAIESGSALETYQSGFVVMDEMKTLSIFAPIGFYETDLDEDKVFVSSETESFYKSGWLKRPVEQYGFKATGQDFRYDETIDYLQLSESLHDGVYSISRTLGSYVKKDYEKMNVFVEFLKSRYAYNLEIEDVHVLDDFVSNFVLHMDEGYCTYFASSLAIMGRINGIPTRYVEGFVLTPEELVPGEAVKVTEEKAHAWVEAYIEGYGWVIYEGTPPYAVSSGSETTVNQVPNTPDSTKESDSLGDSGLDQSASSLAERDNISSGADDGRFNLNPVIRDRSKVDKEPEVNVFAKYKYLIGFIVGLLILCALILAFGPSHLYLHPRNSYTRAVRMVYFLTFLAKENAEYQTFDVEKCLMYSNLHPHTIEKYERLLYGAHLEEDLEAIILELKIYLKREKKIFSYRFGRIKYILLRWRQIRNAIGA